jgi:acyl-homoserine lactone acylase PvdQ
LAISFYGQSDDPASPHYSDQAELLGQAELKPNYFDVRELEGALASSRTLDTGPAPAPRRRR